MVGTSLPNWCTENIYSPTDGKIAKYDKNTQSWIEQNSMIGTKYWSYEGEEFIIDKHDGIIYDGYVDNNNNWEGESVEVSEIEYE